MVNQTVTTVTGVTGRVVNVVGNCVEVEHTEMVNIAGGWQTQRNTSTWVTRQQVMVVQR